MNRKTDGETAQLINGGRYSRTNRQMERDEEKVVDKHMDTNRLRERQSDGQREIQIVI